MLAVMLAGATVAAGLHVRGLCARVHRCAAAPGTSPQRALGGAVRAVLPHRAAPRRPAHTLRRLSVSVPACAGFMVLARCGLYLWDVGIAWLDGAPAPPASLEPLSAGLPALIGLVAAWPSAIFSLLVMTSSTSSVPAATVLGDGRLAVIILPIAVGTAARCRHRRRGARVRGARGRARPPGLACAVAGAAARRAPRLPRLPLAHADRARMVVVHGAVLGGGVPLAAFPGPGAPWLTVFTGLLSAGPALAALVALCALTAAAAMCHRVARLERKHWDALARRGSGGSAGGGAGASADGGVEPPLVIAQRESDIRVARAEATYFAYWAIGAGLAAGFAAATVWEVTGQLAPLAATADFAAAAAAIGVSANEPWSPPGGAGAGGPSTHATRITGFWMATHLSFMVSLVLLAHGLQDTWDADDARVVRPESMTPAQRQALADAACGDEAASAVRALVPGVLLRGSDGTYRRTTEDVTGRAWVVQVLTSPLHLISPVRAALARVARRAVRGGGAGDAVMHPQLQKVKASAGGSNSTSRRSGSAAPASAVGCRGSGSRRVITASAHSLHRGTSHSGSGSGRSTLGRAAASPKRRWRRCCSSSSGRSSSSSSGRSSSSSSRRIRTVPPLPLPLPRRPPRPLPDSVLLRVSRTARSRWRTLRIVQRAHRPRWLRQTTTTTTQWQSHRAECLWRQRRQNGGSAAT